MLKQDYIDIINEHFASQGKKLSNLGKANIADLKKVIEKYDIKYDEAECIKEKNIQIKKKKEKEEKEEKEREENYNNYKLEKEKKMNYWKKLDENIKNKLIKWFVLSYQMRFIENYFKNVENNKKVKKNVDELELKIKREGMSVERVNDNTLCINGANVVYGAFKDEEFDIEKTTNDIKEMFEEGSIDAETAYPYLERYNWKVVRGFSIVYKEVNSFKF
tara:strand:+ start:130 stop:786 length:657 start_codon:yes stop_codon:yes gene_type:complete